MVRASTRFFFSLAVLVSMTLLESRAESIRLTPSDDVRKAIRNLSAGEEIVLSGEKFHLSAGLKIKAKGSASAPVIIRSEQGGRAEIIVQSRKSNAIEIRGSSHLILENLVIQGGSQGIRLVNSDYITIEGCEIHNTGDVGISANGRGTYENLTIRNNHIHHTSGHGEAMYLGCNRDKCRVKNSLIEWNYIHDTNGPSVQQGDGIEIKEGSSGNIVRHNVIHDTKYPAIITYGTVGNGPPNVIEGNVVWNIGNNAIQSAADSVIRNNIVLGSPIVLKPHQNASPSNQVVVNNTILSVSDGLVIRGASGEITIANNAIYSEKSQAVRVVGGSGSEITVAGNVVSGDVSGISSGFSQGDLDVDFIGGHFDGTPPIDLFPRPGGHLVGAGVSDFVPDADFNGIRRAGSVDVGAYRYGSEGNPGWRLSAAPKGRDGDGRWIEDPSD